MRITRLMTPALFGAVLLLTSAQPGLAKKCGDAPGDSAAVQAARADVAANCDCQGAANHGAYVKCAAGRANFLSSDAGGNVLPKNCKGAVTKCAARSTCGKPGFVTCCRTTASGKTRCSIKRDAAHCRAPRGGSAATGTGSCCDNCGGAVCGNGTVEPPEECDPPASSCTGAFVGETCQGDCTCATTSTTVVTTSTTIATTSTTIATTSTTIATTSTTIATTSTTIPATSTTTSSTTTTTMGSPSGAFLD